LQQNQTRPLDLKCVFNLDNLPIGFASHLSRQQNGTIDRSPLNNAINKLAEIFGRKVAFGFGIEGRIGMILRTCIIVLKMQIVFHVL
jgi:hypothetical protein